MYLFVALCFRKYSVVTAFLLKAKKETQTRKSWFVILFVLLVTLQLWNSRASIINTYNGTKGAVGGHERLSANLKITTNPDHVQRVIMSNEQLLQLF